VPIRAKDGDAGSQGSCWRLGIQLTGEGALKEPPMFALLRLHEIGNPLALRRPHHM